MWLVAIWQRCKETPFSCCHGSCSVFTACDRHETATYALLMTSRDQILFWVRDHHASQRWNTGVLTVTQPYSEGKWYPLRLRNRIIRILVSILVLLDDHGDIISVATSSSLGHGSVTRRRGRTLLHCSHLFRNVSHATGWWEDWVRTRCILALISVSAMFENSYSDFEQHALQCVKGSLDYMSLLFAYHV